MITNVHIAIRRHLRTMTVKSKTGESFVDGEYTPVYATGVSINLAAFPIGRRDANFFSDGVYTFQDRKFYEIGNGTLQDKSEISFDGNRYLIDGGTKRNFEGGFTTYFGKRIDDNE